MASGRRRAAASSSANVRSAVASVSTSGVLPTGMPRRVARLEVDVVVADGVVGDRFQIGELADQAFVDAVGEETQQSLGVLGLVRQLARAWGEALLPDLDVVHRFEAVERGAGQLACYEAAGH